MMKILPENEKRKKKKTLKTFSHGKNSAMTSSTDISLTNIFKNLSEYSGFLNIGKKPFDKI